MRINRKVLAFTLMEVTIAMLIAAIAIAITYTAYHIVSGTYLDYTKKQDRVASLVVLDKLLKKDFMAAEQLHESAKGLELQGEQGMISYEFNADYILRTQFNLQTDTFKLVVKSFELSFEDKPTSSPELIDQLDLHTALEGRNISTIYKKQYSSQSLFR